MYQENENSFGIPKIAQSSNYYKSISKIIFSPQTVRYNCRLIKKKGDIYRPWYYFGFSKVRQNDIYIVNGHEYEGWKAVCERFSSEHYKVDEEAKIVYNKAFVEIYTKQSTWDQCYYFNTDEDAIRFYHEIVDICKKCGNDLL